MANFDFSNLNLNPREVEEISKVIFEQVFTNPALEKMHRIEEGIDMKTQIVLMNKLGLVSRASTGCSPQESDAGLVASQKYWEPSKLETRFGFCKDTEIPVLLKAFGRQQNKFDMTGSPEVQILAQKLAEGLDESVRTLAWFGDKDAAIVASGGTISDTADVTLVNTVNGFWKQIFAGVTAGKIKRTTIGANTGSTYTAQELSAGEALTSLRNAYNQADSRLKNSSDSQFYVTQSIYDNFLDRLEDAGLNAVGQLAINDGVMSYRGKEIIVANDWDNHIAEYEDNGTKYNLPNRIVFSTPENLPIGTLDKGEFKEVNIWYDATLRKVFIENLYSLDAKVLEEYMISVAY